MGATNLLETVPNRDSRRSTLSTSSPADGRFRIGKRMSVAGRNNIEKEEINSSKFKLVHNYNVIAGVQAHLSVCRSLFLNLEVPSILSLEIFQ